MVFGELPVRPFAAEAPSVSGLLSPGFFLLIIALVPRGFDWRRGDVGEAVNGLGSLV